MANPLVNEQELFDKIANESIRVHPLIWDLMYLHIGEYLSVIDMTAYNFQKKRMDVPVVYVRRILDCALKSNKIVWAILHADKATNLEEHLKDFQYVKNSADYVKTLKPEELTLHPVIHELFTHYVSNDLNIINMISYYYLDSQDEKPMENEKIHRILTSVESMRIFLEKLKQATTQGVSSRKGKND